MSVSLMADTFRAKFPNVKVKGRTIAPATMKIVLLALADHANDEGKYVYPSLIRLETMTGLSRRTIQRTEEGLCSIGVLSEVGKSEYGTTEYSISPATLRRLGGESSSKKARQIRRGGESGSINSALDSKKGALDSPKPLIKPSVEPSVEGKSNPAASAAAYSEFMTNVGTREAEVLLLNAAQLPAVPANGVQYIDTVVSMINVYGKERTDKALRAARQKWINTKKKNGPGNYSPINLGWVDWAMAELSDNMPTETNEKKSYNPFIALEMYLEEVDG